MRDKLHGFTREANFGLPLQLGGDGVLLFQIFLR